MAFVAQSLQLFPGEFSVGIGCEDSDGFVAGVTYDKSSDNAVEANIWVSRQPSLTWVACILDYPFNVLGVGKMVAWVRETNEASVKFCSKLGFVVEGKIADYYRDGSSVLIMTLSAEDCRLLHSKSLMRRVPR